MTCSALRCLPAMSLALSLGTFVAHAAPLIFTPLHASNVYRPGDKVGWTVTLAPGMKPPAGSYSYRITKDNSSVVKTGSFDLSTGSAAISTTAEAPATLRVVVDYMAPPPSPPLSLARAGELNVALRTLLLKTDPTLKDVLDKYPGYEFVPARRFSFTDLMEDRVATLNASVVAP